MMYGMLDRKIDNNVKSDIYPILYIFTVYYRYNKKVFGNHCCIVLYNSF